MGSGAIQHTQHALLVAWGAFAEHIGLPVKLQSVQLSQKSYRHTPQTKVLEFLVAILAGLRHFKTSVWPHTRWTRTRQ